MALKIISRRQWGARRHVGAQKVSWPTGVDLWCHHTTGPTTQTINEIEAFHMGPSRGWSAIGYGYLIRADGTIYEGRGYGIQAAHSPGKNHEPSVALIGDYSTIPPTDAQHRAVYTLKAHLKAGDLRGHRENTATSCPGDAAMRKIVNGPPPVPVYSPPPKKPTLAERLAKAGFGTKSIAAIIAKLKGRTS